MARWSAGSGRPLGFVPGAPSSRGGHFALQKHQQVQVPYQQVRVPLWGASGGGLPTEPAAPSPSPALSCPMALTVRQIAARPHG